MSFEASFNTSPNIVISTPGRVNLIGEHTDYNEGFVLPTVIPQTTKISLSARGGSRVRVASKNMNESGVQSFMLGDEIRHNTWIDYIQGVTQVLASAGRRVTGFDVFIDSTVPTGAGLSSSAALIVGLIKALRLAFNLELKDTAIALLAQRVENEFVGAHVGIMDQMAVALATPGQALFLDTRSLEYKLIALPKSAGLIVINSSIKHSNIGGGYSERRASCEESARIMGVRALRDISIDHTHKLSMLPPHLMKRARHVITENARVQAAVTALQAGDLPRLGSLFKESHVSMRDDFEVSTPEIDILVEIACADPDVFGARLTGGGFGGSIVALASSSGARAAADRIARRFAERTGLVPTVLVPAN